jgi:hypothetical protein
MDYLEKDLGIIGGYCQVCGEPKEVCECQWCRKDEENRPNY